MQNNLGSDPIRPLVWRIAFPSMLAQFVSVLYSIVDRIYISFILLSGESALAGVGVCGPVVTMLGAFAFLVGVGGAPLMSINMGAGRPEEARRILSISFLVLCVCAVVLTAVVFPLQRPMLMFFGASEVTYPYAEEYFSIYLCGTVFNLLSLGMNQIIISQGLAKKGMFSVVLGAVMPALGWLLGSQFAHYVTRFAPWIAFVLLAWIGGNLIRESRTEEEEDEQPSDGQVKHKELLVLAVATSIDALAVGVTFSMVELSVSIWLAVCLIGCTTFLISLGGVYVGNVFGAKYKNKAEFVGGTILILIGVKIILEHFGVL